MSVRGWLIAAVVFGTVVNAGITHRPAAAQKATPSGAGPCVDREQIAADIAETKRSISDTKQKMSEVDQSINILSAPKIPLKKNYTQKRDYRKSIFDSYSEQLGELFTIVNNLSITQNEQIHITYHYNADGAYVTGVEFSFGHNISPSIALRLKIIGDELRKQTFDIFQIDEDISHAKRRYFTAKTTIARFVENNKSVYLALQIRLNNLSQRLTGLESALVGAGASQCDEGSPLVAALPKAGDGSTRKPEGETSGDIDFGSVEVWDGEGDIKPGKLVFPDEYLAPPPTGGDLPENKPQKADDGNLAPDGTGKPMIFPPEYLETPGSGMKGSVEKKTRPAKDAAASAPGKTTGPTSAAGDPRLPGGSLAPPGDGSLTNLATLSPSATPAPKASAGGGNDFFRYIPNPDRWTELMDATPRASQCDYDLNRLCQKLGPQYTADCKAALAPWQTACRSSYPRRGWVSRAACERECQVDALDARADLDIRPMILAVIDSAGGKNPKVFKLSEDLNAARIELQDLEETIRNRRIYIYTNSDTGAIIQHDGAYFDPTPPLVFTGEMKASELPAHTAKRDEITRRIDRLDRQLKAEKAASVDMSDWKSWARRFWLGNGADRQSRYQCEEPEITAGLASCIAYCKSQLSRSSSEPDYVSNDFCGHDHAFQWLHHPAARLWLYPPGHPSRKPARNELVGFRPMIVPKLPVNPFAGMSKEQIGKSIRNSARPEPRPVMPTAPLSPALR